MQFFKVILNKQDMTENIEGEKLLRLDLAIASFRQAQLHVSMNLLLLLLSSKQKLVKDNKTSTQLCV
jgi:hypothetical protein